VYFVWKLLTACVQNVFLGAEYTRYLHERFLLFREDDMVEACDTRGECEKCIQNFGVKV
jgi:hypothetical protein